MEGLFYAFEFEEKARIDVTLKREQISIKRKEWDKCFLNFTLIFIHHLKLKTVNKKLNKYIAENKAKCDEIGWKIRSRTSKTSFA